MFQLLIFLPVILFFLVALGIVFLQQSRPRIGYSWLIAAVSSLLITIFVIFLRSYLPLEFVADQWQLFDGITSPTSFLLDLSSWPYVLCLVVLALAFIFTDAARLQTEAHPYNWAIGLGFTGVGLLAVMAKNPLTLVVSWTAVDLIELVIVMSTDAGRRMGRQTVTLFSVRSGGSLLVILAILLARSRGLPFDLNPIPSELAVYMLLAAGLRLGALPLNPSYTREVYQQRGLGNLMRMIGPASSLVVLGRMPEQVVPFEWRSLFLGVCAFAALYGGAMWLAADNELNGRPYWSVAFAALAIASAINGNARASIAWGLALILAGSVLFFYSARRRRNLLIPIVALIGITGLPYTPAAMGWVGIAGGHFNFYTLLFLLSLVFLIWGFIHFCLLPREELHHMERWVHPVYPMGLISLVIVQWVIGVWGWPGSFTTGVWWASTTVVILAGIGIAVAASMRKNRINGVTPPFWLGIVFGRVGSALGSFFRLNWLYQFLLWLYHGIQNLIQLITAILEGDGGILWTMVFLALLISMIRFGGQP